MPEVECEWCEDKFNKSSKEIKRTDHNFCCLSHSSKFFGKKKQMMAHLVKGGLVKWEDASLARMRSGFDSQDLHKIRRPSYVS